MNQFTVKLKDSVKPIYVLSPCQTLEEFSDWFVKQNVYDLPGGEKMIIKTNYLIAASGPNRPFSSIYGSSDPFP